MFTEPTITWVPSGFSGYIWLDTKIVFKKKNLIPGSVGYISHVHRAYDYSGRSFGVLWVHMTQYKNWVLKKRSIWNEKYKLFKQMQTFYRNPS